MPYRKNDFLLVIPARYASSRFPVKPLAKINGIPMIERTYNQCLKATSRKNIIVATDHKKIQEFCNSKNIPNIITSKKCLTGTDRVVEVAKKKKFNFYINVQGDEPIFNPQDIKLLIKNMSKFPDQVLNGYCNLSDNIRFHHRDCPKAVISKSGRLMYASRKPIPINGLNKKLGIYPYRQVCAYSFPRKLLLKFASSKKMPLEKLEDIEILRFIELDIPVKMLKMSPDSIAVDRKSHIKKVENKLNK